MQKESSNHADLHDPLVQPPKGLIAVYKVLKL